MMVSLVCMMMAVAAFGTLPCNGIQQISAMAFTSSFVSPSMPFQEKIATNTPFFALKNIDGDKEQMATMPSKAPAVRPKNGRRIRNKNAADNDGSSQFSNINKGQVKVKIKDAATNKKRKKQSKNKSSTKSKKKERPKAKRKAKEASFNTVLSNDDIYIQFSRVFQRHVVYRKIDMVSSGDTTASTLMDDEVLQSFEFLDDAVKSYPTARVLAPRDLPFPPPSCSLVYPDEENDGNSRQLTVGSRGRMIDTNVEEEECETTIAGMGLWTLCELEYDDNANNATATGGEYQYEQANAALRTLLQLVSSSSSFVMPRHFFRLDARRLAMRGHTPESITMNHFRVVNLLSRGNSGSGGDNNDVGLAMDPSEVAFVLQNFPQLCLYDCGDLECLVRFLLQPLPPVGSFPSVAMVADRGVSGSNVDWPSLFGKGYGAGLTLEQATKVCRVMPELLALYFEDSRKPSIMYMYSQMRTQPVSPKLIDEANMQLSLEGADPCDSYTFAYLASLKDLPTQRPISANYLRSLAISWGQLRILTSSLRLWLSCNLEPGWELLGRGPIRSMLKRPALDYLRQRLQIGPSDVYRMLKTHTRLSTYDGSNKIMPILDKLQMSLKLSSAELRRLILRMPSLTGIGFASLNGRLDFFTNEGMSDVNNFCLLFMLE